MRLLLILLLAACSTTKTDPPPIEKADTGEKVMKDSFPVCVKVLIEKFKAEPVANPPRSIVRYSYHDKTVYYVPAVCCDQFSDLYNDSCRVMGHPDGGFTGRGDGKFKDWAAERKDEHLIWKDPRQ